MFAGFVTTYARIAKALGCGSSQAVGQALKRNPYAPVGFMLFPNSPLFAIVAVFILSLCFQIVPCHRVIGSSLEIGGFCGHSGPER
jgi:methylated-DNA-[protein]-cysteine S-methyltransferase